MRVHPSAIISPEATIDASAEIGAYVMIEGPVKIGAKTRILPHAHILGDTEIANDCLIGRGAIIGENPQDLSFDVQTPSGVRIGSHNTIREYVTIHRGGKAGNFTRVGNHNFIMAGSHFAHDVHITDHNVLANNVLLAGHVQLGSRSFIGGGSVVHQFIRLGDGCMIQGNSAISKDIPHYCVASQLNNLTGLNVIGLRRQGFSSEERAMLKSLFSLFYRSGLNFSQAVAEAKQQTWPDFAQRWIQFFDEPSSKGICGLKSNH